jgi:K(+)-stimulated pyrophosphate-energized sodium pump
MALDIVILFTPLAGIFALIFVGIFAWWVIKQEAGNARMQEIASFIQQGANAFLRREFQTIAYFIVGLAVLLYIVMPRGESLQIAVGFITGALLSMLAITIGMNVATRANVRTTQAARTLPGKALTVAFRGGAVMGLTIVAFNLLGISVLSILFGVGPENPERVSLLVGFGFGASLSSLFAQLGGGIFTKAADVGADLAGKVELGIPEDDPRNAAVIADLVGDNVGDCAGRGADLFESGSDNLVATMIMGLAFMNPIGAFPGYGFKAVLFPLLTRSIGAIGAVLGVVAVRGTGKRNPIASLNLGFFVTGIFSVFAFYILANWVMEDMRLFWCLLLGLGGALASALIVQYYTGAGAKPVQEIAEAATSGPGVNIIAGMAYGFESAVLPKIIIAVINVAAYYIMGGGVVGFFGIAAATLGITEMKGIIMAGDAFGPIADNAGGIAELSGLGEEVRRSADVLDSAGNIAKAITKGYSMSTALLTSVVILFTYITEISRHLGEPLTDVVYSAKFALVDPLNITGIMIGSTIPFLFSAQAIRAVSRTAYKVVDEVRRQFREIPGLMEGTANADYATCVDIATRDSLKGMILPTLWGVVFPVAMGFIFNVWALAAFLIGVKIIGATLAMFMFNSGGAWDNAKKFIEDGNLGGKGSHAHRSAVIGDTVGDPLKDTSGPSLHILIKLQNILAITLLPLFIEHGAKW